MKIEVGESLVYSYLKHVKKCLITQTNWKPSEEWSISEVAKKETTELFEKINKHSSFEGIFKSGLKQTIKQAELDVIGIDPDDHVYAYEIAFHENGLQYGGKLDTRDRVIKKLLRSYLVLKYFFPDKKYSIAFCSPKINPASKKYLQEYFEILKKDFEDIEDVDVEFLLFSNNQFSEEILSKTLRAIDSSADSGELFSRSIKLLNLTEKLPKTEIILDTDTPEKNNIHIEYTAINNIKIPLIKQHNETVQNFVKKVFSLLFKHKLLTDEEIKNLQNQEYCKNKFKLQDPLLRPISDGRKDHLNYGRYWVDEFGGEFHICSQWKKAKEDIYLQLLKDWLLSISSK